MRVLRNVIFDSNLSDQGEKDGVLGMVGEGEILLAGAGMVGVGGMAVGGADDVGRGAIVGDTGGLGNS